VRGAHDDPEFRGGVHILLFFNCRERRRASATNVGLSPWGVAVVLGYSPVKTFALVGVLSLSRA